MYAVLSGTKVFTLLPPCDVWRMGMQRYPAARWTKQPQPPCSGEGPGGEGLSTEQPRRESQGDEEEGGPSSVLSAEGGGAAVVRGCGAEAVAERSAAAPLLASASRSSSRWKPVLHEDPEQSVAWCAIDPRPGGSEGLVRHRPEARWV